MKHIFLLFSFFWVFSSHALEISNKNSTNTPLDIEVSAGFEMNLRKLDDGA